MLPECCWSWVRSLIGTNQRQ